MPIPVPVDVRPVLDAPVDPVARVDVEPLGHRIADGTAPPPGDVWRFTAYPWR